MLTRLRDNPRRWILLALFIVSAVVLSGAARLQFQHARAAELAMDEEFYVVVFRHSIDTTGCADRFKGMLNRYEAKALTPLSISRSVEGRFLVVVATAEVRRSILLWGLVPLERRTVLRASNEVVGSVAPGANHQLTYVVP